MSKLMAKTHIVSILKETQARRLTAKELCRK